MSFTTNQRLSGVPGAGTYIGCGAAPQNTFVPFDYNNHAPHLARFSTMPLGIEFRFRDLPQCSCWHRNPASPRLVTTPAAWQVDLSEVTWKGVTATVKAPADGFTVHDGIW